MKTQPYEYEAEIARLREEIETQHEQHERDMDELRQRLVDEHEGHSARVDAKAWEKQCHAAEDEVCSLKVKLEDAKALILKLQGHMNEGCSP